LACRRADVILKRPINHTASRNKTMSDLIRALEAENSLDRPDAVPVEEIRAGDTVRAFFRIVEGRRERVQPFQGVVIRVRRGRGPDANMTVRRTGAHGVGVERTFPLHSERLEKVEVLRHAHVRQARLYYLRERTGKRARLRQKRRYFQAQEEAEEYPAGADARDWERGTRRGTARRPFSSL
jgi:large subunit ribosomal protein L19